ncbi:SH3 domain-containing protein [Sutcliffiella horikoshii]|uniref:SH3 domain-containing protein n=1 Tax=Sutcliffiella horikoshii TaxID=79883 RepID=UPI00203FA4D4|nr:SH3 domain-containing protein [Sutcliffiella horikoshii]MCM3617727.1 SH3 domain-containing protein [Sutcliffiella horikoshii]
MSKYTVIKNHTSKYPDPIILKKDQEVLYGIEDTQYPNWIFCKSTSTNKEGWVPKQILTIPNLDRIAIVTQDYSAHELTIKEGETVLGLANLNDWTYCKTENKELGWIPTSCLSRQ